MELDPRHFSFLEEAGFTYSGLGRYTDGSELLKRAIALSPKDYYARVQLALNSYFERGDLGPLRTQLNEFRKEGNEATTSASQFFVQCALLDHDRSAAVQASTGKRP